MKRSSKQTSGVGGDIAPVGGAAPGKRTRTDGFEAVSDRVAPPVLSPASASTAHEDPFGMHIAPGAAAPASAAVQMRGGGARQPPAPAAPAVPDPIVRGAATAADRLPSLIVPMRALANDFDLARSQLDGDSVGAIGLKLAAAFDAAEATLQQLDEGVGNAELLGAVGVDYAWDPAGDKDAARSAELGSLAKSRDEMTGDLTAQALLVANSVRPTSFQHKGVPDVGITLRAHEMGAFVREQTVKTVLLIDTADEIKVMLEGAAGQPKDAATALRREAANRLQFWLTDRDGFLFLSHVLRQIGHGDLLQERGMDGIQLDKTVEAVTRGVPQTVDEIIETVRKARALDLDGNRHAATAYLNLALDRVRQLATHDKIKESLPKGVHGLTLEHALSASQEASSGLEAQAHSLAVGERMGEGLWNYRLRQLETAGPVLRVITGETAFEASFLAAVAPASKTSLITAGIMGGTIIAGAAGATWLAANAAAVAEVGLGAYAAAVSLVVRNPYAATAIAEFAAGIGFQVLDVGSLENFLESLKTPEGVMQLAMDLLAVKQSMGGGRYAADADAPDAPRRVPDMDEGSTFGAEVRDVLDRARAFKAATVELAKNPPRGHQPAAVTPDGDAMPVPRQPGDDPPSFSTVYSQQLDRQRATRAARGGRRMWPTHDQWEAEYQAPPPGKDASEIREKLMDAARERYPVADDMPHEQQADTHWKQRRFFDRVEQNARERREQLETERGDVAPDNLKWHEEQIDAARLVEQAAKVKPAQGRLPINHQLAGEALTLDAIDAQLGNLKISGETRVKLQRLRKLMVERGIVEVRYTEDGYPDFSPFVYEKDGVKAQVDMYLRGDRPLDDTLANQRYREMIGDPSWKQPITHTWHHTEAVGRMLLVPRSVHEAFKHTGGVPWYRILTGDYDAYRKED